MFNTWMDLPPRPELFDFHGISMTHCFTDNWENIQNFQAKQDDILIATYPKAGTTWVSYMLDLLYFGQTFPERQISTSIYQTVPFLEINVPFMDSGVVLANKLDTSPRLIKTHFPVQFVPKSFWEQNCRVVYVARNAKDNVVSFFHFDRMNKVVFGSWYDHVNGWWKKKQTHSKVHYMFYEDLIEDAGQELDKLCHFLDMSPSVETKTWILDRAQFHNMKNNTMVNHSVVPVMDFEISHFMRKGKVGDWKNHFTVAQNEMFDEDYKMKMTDSTLQFRTEI
uniref:Sulfotransferase n=1 Tax=Mola mola TaxID=94237 RepID=A0A3Q3X9K0_MOLML